MSLIGPIAAPDVCDGTSAVGESRHRIPGAHPLINRLNLAPAEHVGQVVLAGSACPAPIDARGASSLTNGLPSRTNVCTRRKRTCGKMWPFGWAVGHIQSLQESCSSGRDEPTFPLMVNGSEMPSAGNRTLLNRQSFCAGLFVGTRVLLLKNRGGL